MRAEIFVLGLSRMFFGFQDIYGDLGISYPTYPFGSSPLNASRHLFSGAQTQDLLWSLKGPRQPETQAIDRDSYSWLNCSLALTIIPVHFIGK